MPVLRPTRPDARLVPPFGLTEQRAAEVLAAHGRNDLDPGARHPLRDAVAHQLTDTVVVVLLAAAVLTAAVGDATDTAVILAVIVLNTTLGVGQDLRSGRALAALAALTAPRATVVRDGRPRDVDAAEVVPDDLLRMAAGDIIAADAVVMSAEALQADESMLTGESVPATKRAGDPLSAGTVIVRGHADAIVTATGRDTRMGGIAHTRGCGGGRARRRPQPARRSQPRVQRLARHQPGRGRDPRIAAGGGVARPRARRAAHERARRPSTADGRGRGARLHHRAGRGQGRDAHPGAHVGRAGLDAGRPRRLPPPTAARRSAVQRRLPGRGGDARPPR